MPSIYALVDPRTNMPRYVGKSDNPEERFKSHMRYDDDCHKDRWINQLIELGLEPKLVVYAEVRDEAWQEAERLLIAGFREMGFDLTNDTDGGEGCSGSRHTDEFKQAVSEFMKGNTYATAGKGVKRSAEARARMSAAAKRRGISEETQRKLAEARRKSKKWHNAVAAANRARAGRPGRPHTEESKRKLSEAAKCQWRRQKGEANNA